LHVASADENSDWSVKAVLVGSALEHLETPLSATSSSKQSPSFNTTDRASVVILPTITTDTGPQNDQIKPKLTMHSVCQTFN